MVKKRRGEKREEETGVNMIPKRTRNSDGDAKQ